jgi:signal transduction histidine kinase/CheY-like chemotaxis protein
MFYRIFMGSGTVREVEDYTARLLLAEEEQSEKIANYWRLGISVLFFGVTAGVAREIPPLSVRVLVAGSTLYFIFSVFMFFHLRRGGYRPYLKYLSVSVDIGLTTLCIWAFGTYRTFKTEAFLLYFIWIAMATMRLSTRLTLFAGTLSLAGYALLVALALLRGTIETGSISESFVSPRVSILNQVLRLIYMSIVIVGVTYGARAYTRLARVTREKEIDAERERMKAQRLESIGFLAGGIAHDFNNILAIISNNLYLARAHLAGSGRADEKIAAAERAALRARSLTDQLLTFSKGGSPIKAIVSLAAIAGESARFALMGSGVRHELDLPEGLHPVEVDEGQMHQVLNNLLINAVQAGSTLVSIGAANVSVAEGPRRPGRYVRLSVRDNGAGIEAGNLARIFDPYFTTRESGSGLGLATSYSIVTRHGGYIDVESAPGRGAAFHLVLPAAETATPAAPPACDPPVEGRRYRVLVIEDEAALGDSIGETLSGFGHAPLIAATGEEAVELYSLALREGRRFDVVLADLVIPGAMGGREAVARILALDPGARALAVSGYSRDPVMADYRRHGFRGVVPKPFSVDALIRAIDEAVADRRGL